MNNKNDQADKYLSTTENMIMFINNNLGTVRNNENIDNYTQLL